MLNTEGMRFPIDVILVCIRRYAAYPLSFRHLEEMMEERGVFVTTLRSIAGRPDSCRCWKKYFANTNVRLV